MTTDTEREALRKAIMAEMAGLCDNRIHRWHGWPGTWEFAEAAIRVIERKARAPAPAPQAAAEGVDDKISQLRAELSEALAAIPQAVRNERNRCASLCETRARNFTDGRREVLCAWAIRGGDIASDASLPGSAPGGEGTAQAPRVVAWQLGDGGASFISDYAKQHNGPHGYVADYTIALVRLSDIAPTAQERTPLTDGQIDRALEIAYKEAVARGEWNGGMCGEGWDHIAARAIERAHGIERASLSGEGV